MYKCALITHLFVMGLTVKIYLLQSTSLTAVGRLVRSVATVVLSVTLPPERDTLVILADKLMKDVRGTYFK